jgi:hypothetical protein
MRFLKKVGYLFTVLALGVAISAVSPVMASAVKTISAKVNDTVSVVLNGEKVQLKTQPIEYNSQNYLPVGEIGRSLGLDVNYDKSKNAINISSSTQSTSSQSNDQGNKSNQPVDKSTEQANTSKNPVEQQKNSNLKQEYKVGETIQFTDASFKVVDISINPDYNDLVQEVTLNVEAEINKIPVGLSGVQTGFFINDDKNIVTVSGNRASWSQGYGSGDLPLNTLVKSKIMIYIPKNESLKQIKITNPLDVWDYDSDRYKNPEKTYINFQ